MVKQVDNPNYLRGALFGFAAASIWASWSAITRLAVTTSLGAWDIAALRYGVAGILLSPVLMQRGLALNRLGWLGLVVIIAGGGAPYALVAASGLRLAPAGDQAALNPGCVPLFVALIAGMVLGEKVSTARKFGLSAVLTGAFVIIGWHPEAWIPRAPMAIRFPCLRHSCGHASRLACGERNLIHFTRQHLSPPDRW
jgi:drug/metabolite transporter (DMT)-like permease